MLQHPRHEPPSEFPLGGLGTLFSGHVLDSSQGPFGAALELKESFQRELSSTVARTCHEQQSELSRGTWRPLHKLDLASGQG